MLLRNRDGNDESSAAHRYSNAASATLTRDEFVCVLLAKQLVAASLHPSPKQQTVAGSKAKRRSRSKA